MSQDQTDIGEPREPRDSFHTPLFLRGTMSRHSTQSFFAPNATRRVGISFRRATLARREARRRRAPRTIRSLGRTSRSDVPACDGLAMSGEGSACGEVTSLSRSGRDELRLGAPPTPPRCTSFITHAPTRCPCWRTLTNEISRQVDKWIFQETRVWSRVIDAERMVEKKENTPRLDCGRGGP